MSERTITVKIDCEDKTCGKCEHREKRSGYVSNHDCLIYGAWAEWDGITRLEECIKAEQHKGNTTYVSLAPGPKEKE